MSKPRSERARIHGLYGKLITSKEKAQLAKMRLTNIEGEIVYLRVLCSRLAKKIDENGLKEGDAEPLSDVAIRMLNTLDLKLNTLLRYIKTLAYLKGEPSEYDRQIEEGEFIARKRRNVFNYLSPRKKTPESDGPGGLGDV